MSRRRIKHRIKGMQVERSERFFVSAGEFGVFASELKPACVSDFEDYMEAHRLMPYNYLYDPDTCVDEVCQAIAVLHEQEPTGEDLLRAIGILGHSPCRYAVEALDEYRRCGGRFAGAAELALSECSGMFGQGCGAVLAM